MSQPTLVALDIETTGLDSHSDAIIEIGAIRFRGDRIEDEYHTLLNPGRSIPRNVVELTGITDAMVARAPRAVDKLPELEEFVGDDPVVGHNVRFDLSFLRAGKILRYNEAVDTYPIASALMPTATRYNLGALARQLGIVLPATHRALDDTRVTVAVYQTLYLRALALPLQTLAEIVNLQQDVDWGANLLFEEALRARSRELATGRTARDKVSLEPRIVSRGLLPVAEPTPLDDQALARLLEPGGAFAQKFTSYEFRPQQVRMLQAVARAFSEGKHAMVEAGTGTGKSFAYLVPAAQWAVQNGQRVVVSTNTINLQEQLLRKDVPDVEAALKIGLKAALLKGRSNYLCPRRLDNARRHRPKQADEMRVLAKVLTWLATETPADDETAERPALSLGPGDRAAWVRLSAEDENCTLNTCQTRMHGSCAYYQARRAAEAAHILIVNHALLLADIAAGQQVLPAYNYLVLDEAHHLEAATTDALGFEATRLDLDKQFKELGSPTGGLLGTVLGALREALAPDAYIVVEAETVRAFERAGTALETGRSFFEAISDFLTARRDGRPISDYGQSERITPPVRQGLPWSGVTQAWEQARPSFDALTRALTRVRTYLVELAEGDADADREALEELAADVNNQARFFTRLIENLDGLVLKPDPTTIYWAEADNREGRASVHAAPLHVGSLVEKHLWQEKESVVMASATLTTGGSFSYLRGRLNATDVTELVVGSPFDYAASTLLYLATDIPEPQMRQDYQKGVERGLIDLCLATRGRALVLFTSYAQLKQTANAIRGPLSKAGIDLYDQTNGSSRSALLDNFKAADAGVLLGTKSFWEGVDIPGDTLSSLVITRLPFDVPDDPIIAARSETFEKPFEQYSVPEAVLKFRQGFGRLIRTQSDRGVVAVFDRRILTKTYGRVFLESLPACTVKRAPLAQIGPEAKAWLERPR